MSTDKRFKKAYIEITNICNLSCSFCPGTKRKGQFMSAGDFAVAAQKLRPFTDYIYLHVLGEPTIHPQLGEILNEAKRLGYKTGIVTNGTTLKETGEILVSSETVFKISVSLHSFESNFPAGDPGDYIEEAAVFAKKASENGKICALRLWNGGSEAKLNDNIENALKKHFPGEWKLNPTGRKIADRVYLEEADRFEWPAQSESEKNVRFCMGLKDQIAVLCDGTVVPCCLDSEGEIRLGSIFVSPLADILSSDRTVRFIESFSRGEPSEELCRRCSFAEQKFSRQTQI